MKIVIIISFIFLTTTIYAQNFQGKAYYQTKRNVEIKLDSSQVNNEMQKQIQEMLIKQFKKTYILTFNKNESIYKEEQQLDKPQSSMNGVSISIGGSSDVLYKNFKQGIFVNFTELFGKKFLIKDKITPLKWKITKETKMIGQYICIKATAIEMIDDFDDNYKKKETLKEKHITAWYTPEIPVTTGPDRFGSLPGLILELHKGKMHYICNKIVMNPKEKIKIEASKKGKKINKKDFDIMKAQKSKEMMKHFKGGRKKGDNSGVSIFIGG